MGATAETTKRRPRGEGRNKRALRQLLQLRYPDYEPVMKMAEAAMEVTQIAADSKAQGNNDVDLWVQVIEAHNKVARYLTPQLAAVKVEADINHNAGVLVVPARPGSIENWAQAAQEVLRQQEEGLLEHLDDSQ